MSFWPGYVFQSKGQPYPGLENNAAMFLGDRLSPSQQALYRILSSPSAIQAKIASHATRLVVLGNQEYGMVEAGPLEQVLLRSSYRVVNKIGNTTLWLTSATR